MNPLRLVWPKALDGAQAVLWVSLVIAAEHETHIAREPEAVFDYFADLRNEPEWNHGHVCAVRMTSPPPIGQGTTFEGKHPGFGDATWRLVEYDRPYHLVIEGFVGTAPYRYVGDFRPTDGGTLFRGRVEWDPRGLAFARPASAPPSQAAYAPLLSEPASRARALSPVNRG